MVRRPSTTFSPDLKSVYSSLSLGYVVLVHLGVFFFILRNVFFSPQISAFDKAPFRRRRNFAFLHRKKNPEKPIDPSRSRGHRSIDRDPSAFSSLSCFSPYFQRRDLNDNDIFLLVYIPGAVQTKDSQCYRLSHSDLCT